jgi:GT2 family glycosyltransferase
MDRALTRGAGKQAPAITISVLTFNRAALLQELLESLVPLLNDDLELLVIDNHSADATPRVVGDFLGRTSASITSIRTEENVGVGARNLGLKQARGDIVICLDDDVFGIDAAAIATIRAAFGADPRLGAINFKVIDARTHAVCNWVHHCELETYADAEFDTYEITEGAVAFRRCAVREAGWYPEHFFLSHEGPDLAFRLLNCGYRAIYRGDIVVRHCHATAGRQSWMSYYYDTRNQYWLAMRNLPVLYGLRYLARGQVSTAIYALRDGYFKYWLRAVRDGIAALPKIRRERRTVAAATMRVIRQIDSNQPSWVYMARKRLFRKQMRL